MKIIEVVPLKVHFEDEVYRDGVDIMPAEFYDKLRNAGEIIPRTSQPSPGDFVETYRELAKEGSGPILSVHISSKLSGCLQSAQMAAEMLPELDITVVDSEAVAMILGLQALVAARAAEKGASKEAILATLKADIREADSYFVVDTLEYLERNGRIGRASAFLGTILSIKPLLGMRDGVVTGLEKIRGRGKAVQRIIELIKQSAGDRKIRLSVVHSDSLEEAKGLAERLKGEVNCSELIIAELGPVVGCHAGPGLVAALYLPDRE
jgi:DegV family protein with EDD domain